MNNLAEVLNNQGKYEEAEKIHRQTLALKETVLGKKHPDTLASVYCLAYVLHSQQRYDSAEALYKRASTGYQETLGLNHPRTQACIQHYQSMLQEMNARVL